MGIESLELAIENAKEELEKREPRKMVAWAVITASFFFIPVFMFFNQSSDSVYHTSYAPIVIVWVIVTTMLIGNVIAEALFSARTTELKLSLAMAESISAFKITGDN